MTAPPVPPVVMKIGGNEIDDPAFLAGLAPVVLSVGAPVIVVHGGGREIAALQRALGIEPRYLDGVRVTDAESLAVAEMVLRGAVNTRLVRHLLAGGIMALGVSGVDLGLICAEKMFHPEVDMGFTGVVTDVRADILRGWLAQGIIPVIAPICLGADNVYNVNADHVAGAVAAAVAADCVVFLTNVEGVLVNHEPLPALDEQSARSLIAEGVIFGGMIPKVQTALQTLELGVRRVVITNLKGLQTHGGTVFTRAVHAAKDEDKGDDEHSS